MSNAPFVLDVVAVERSGGPDSPLELGCAGCGSPLDLHQPEAATPERLLATCGDCGAWYLVEPTPDGRALLSCRLPGGPELRAAWESSGRDRGPEDHRPTPRRR